MGLRPNYKYFHLNDGLYRLPSSRENNSPQHLQIQRAINLDAIEERIYQFLRSHVDIQQDYMRFNGDRILGWRIVTPEEYQDFLLQYMRKYQHEKTYDKNAR